MPTAFLVAAAMMVGDMAIDGAASARRGMGTNDAQHVPRPNCFAVPNSNSHLAGRWVRHAADRPVPYDVEHKFWNSIQVAAKIGSNHHYGNCARRTQFDWVPDACSLHRFESLGFCELCRQRGWKQILFVGDSTVAQVFISLIFQLEGPGAVERGNATTTIEHNRSNIGDTVASVCNDNVRMNFVRNDLLTWANSGNEVNLVRACSGFTLLGHFVHRAVVDADLLVMGTGLDVPLALPEKMLWAHAGDPHVDARSMGSDFFIRNLNHTLARALAARRRLGRLSESVVLLGPPFPVPGCARFSEPQQLAESLVANASWSRWSSQWQQVRTFSQLTGWIAMHWGVGFLDIGPLSLQRPDATMAHGAKIGTTAVEDCVHYCMPGPPDTWVQLLYNHLSAQPVVQSGQASRIERRWFAMSRDAWLGYNRHKVGAWQFEAIANPGTCGTAQGCYQCMSQFSWWPYIGCKGEHWAAKQKMMCLKEVQK